MQSATVAGQGSVATPLSRRKTAGRWLGFVPLIEERYDIAVWRSVRAGGDTKTRTSRRTLALPHRAAEALRAQRDHQGHDRTAAGPGWREHNRVFASRMGTPLDAADVRRAFRAVLREVSGLNAAEWTPRELRHSFVSLLSDTGVPLEDISRLVGHRSSTAVTELVYRKQIRPVLQLGATVMDQLFHRGGPTP